jgi:hypothetical protein
MTADSYRQCKNCGKALYEDRYQDGRSYLSGGKKSGRPTEYCNATCRQQARRKRLKDPEQQRAFEQRVEKRRKARERAEKRQAEVNQRAWQIFNERLRFHLSRHVEPERNGNELFNDRTMKLLALALSNDNDHESDLAFHKAREEYRRTVTKGES